jgi:hypothetical protein
MFDSLYAWQSVRLLPNLSVLVHFQCSFQGKKKKELHNVELEYNYYSNKMHTFFIIKITRYYNL